MRILWVENHMTFTRIAGKQFLSAHALTIVPSLAAARHVLTGQTFEVVLLDYDLDDGKGTSLIDFIQQLPNRPAVIAASAQDAGNEAMRLAGADAVCNKLRFADIEAIMMQVEQMRKNA